MPSRPPSVNTERPSARGLSRAAARRPEVCITGSPDEQTRARPTVSALSVAGLIKHAATTEKSWIQTMTGNVEYANEQAYVDSFTLTEQETLESVIADLDQGGCRDGGGGGSTG